MVSITREVLHGYLDDSLADPEIAQVEQALRASEPLRHMLRAVIQERDRGEHSIGAIWRRQRLSCPSRDQLGSYLLEVLAADIQDYIQFHLETVGCPFCQANMTDLKHLQKEPAPKATERRKRFFESSAGLLQAGRETKK